MNCKRNLTFVLPVLLGTLVSTQAVAVPLVPLPRPSVGMASWYGDFHHDRRTASGAIFRTDELTAAHPSLPLGSSVRVTNLSNNRSVVVKVTDRGPHTRNRLIDVSEAAASILNFKLKGLARVMLSPLTKGETKQASLERTAP